MCVLAVGVLPFASSTLIMPKKPKRTPEAESRRRQFNVMLRAFKLTQIRTSHVILARAIKKDRGNISSILHSHGDIHVIQGELNHYFRTTAPGIWRDALKQIWLNAGAASIELHNSFFNPAGTKAYDADEEDEWEPVFNFFETMATKAADNDTWANSVDGYLRGGGSDHISGIADTTKSNVMGAIADGVADGEPTRDIAARVEDQLDTTWPGRAQTITMTETAAACNQASLETAQAAAPGLNKTWTCSFVARSRDTHMDADGMSVPQDQPFEIGDEELMFPCDPDGSAEETVNCLCTLGYEEAPAEEAVEGEEAAPELTADQTSDLADLFDQMASGTGMLSDDEQAALAGQIGDIVGGEAGGEVAPEAAISTDYNEGLMATDEWAKTISLEDQGVITEYSDGRQPSAFFEGTDNATTLSRLIDDAPSFEGTLLRGVNSDELAAELSSMNPDDIYTFTRFASTSTERNVAEFFATGDEQPIEYELINARGMQMENIGRPAFKNQKEVLMNIGTTGRIKSIGQIQTYYGTTIMHVVIDMG